MIWCEFQVKKSVWVVVVSFFFFFLWEGGGGVRGGGVMRIETHNGNN